MGVQWYLIVVINLHFHDVYHFFVCFLAIPIVLIVEVSIQTFVHFDEIIQFFTLGRERISPFSKSQVQIQLKTTVSEFSEVQQISHLHHP